jgi:hypothetical protein
MWNPPPIPALCGLTAPMQKIVATAASTAFPPSTKTSLQKDLKNDFNFIFIAIIIKFKIYRPIFEQGIPSELTAAVLNFPNREGDGGEKGLSELLLTSANLNITFE